MELTLTKSEDKCDEVTAVDSNIGKIEKWPQKWS